MSILTNAQQEAVDDWVEARKQSNGWTVELREKHDRLLAEINQYAATIQDFPDTDEGWKAFREWREPLHVMLEAFI